MFIDFKKAFDTLDHIILLQIVQDDLTGVETWCKYHKLSINVNKTKAMLFGTNELANPIEIGNNSIEFVNSYKYLGIHL